jgi:Rap1a immunity proteins
MRLILVFSAILFTVLCAHPARAEFKDGNELYDSCSVGESDSTFYQSQAMCMGYITGVSDMLELNQMPGQRLMVCVPSDVTAQQMADVVRKYLRENLQERHLDAALLVWGALVRVWPCSKVFEK